MTHDDQAMTVYGTQVRFEATDGIDHSANQKVQLTVGMSTVSCMSLTALALAEVILRGTDEESKKKFLTLLHNVGENSTSLRDMEKAVTNASVSELPPPVKGNASALDVMLNRLGEGKPVSLMELIDLCRHNSIAPPDVAVQRVGGRGMALELRKGEEPKEDDTPQRMEWVVRIPTLAQPDTYPVDEYDVWESGKTLIVAKQDVVVAMYAEGDWSRCTQRRVVPILPEEVFTRLNNALEEYAAGVSMDRTAQREHIQARDWLRNLWYTQNR